MPFDGVIFSPISLSAEELRAQARSTPVVPLGEHIIDGGLDHVAIDNVAAAADATQNLLSIDRRRVAAIGNQPYDTGETAQLRTIGYRRADQLAGSTSTPRWWCPPTLPPLQRGRRHAPPPSDGGTAGRRVLLQRPVGLGAMKALADAGLRVPDDVAVVGFDDIEGGRYATPSLTTVELDKEFIATQAVERLIGHIDGSTTGPRREIRAPHTQHIRQSTTG